MKTIQKLTLIMVFSLAIGSGAIAQDQKKFNIYLNMDRNGKSITIDTTFTSREDMQDFLQSQGFETSETIDLPELPDLNDLSDMKEISIDIDAIDFSPEKKAEIKEAMEMAKKEMEKASEEMKIHQGEMEKHKGEMEKARKEMKMMKIEIDENGNGSPKKVIIHSTADGDTKTWTTDDDVIINLNDQSDTFEYKYKIIQLKDDKNTGDGKKMRTIRKVEVIDEKNKESEESTGELKSNDREQLPPAPEPKNDSEASHKLAASDFKIYPNPTQGKITVSFKTEKDGPVSVKLLDANGKVVVDDEVLVNNGIFNAEYNIEGNARGTYLLQLKQGDQWRHEKIVMK